MGDTAVVLSTTTRKVVFCDVEPAPAPAIPPHAKGQNINGNLRPITPEPVMQEYPPP